MREKPNELKNIGLSYISTSQIRDENVMYSFV